MAALFSKAACDRLWRPESRHKNSQYAVLPNCGVRFGIWLTPAEHVTSLAWVTGRPLPTYVTDFGSTAGESQTATLEFESVIACDSVGPPVFNFFRALPYWLFELCSFRKFFQGVLSNMKGRLCFMVPACVILNFLWTRCLWIFFVLLIVSVI